jgi:anti-sigma factor RsiW
MVAEHQPGQLLAYVEQRLSPEAQSRMAAHLAGCAACRREADDLAPVVEALRAMPEALRRVPGRAQNNWPRVWGRVQPGGSMQRAGGLIPAVGRYLPRVTVYLGLLVGALTASMIWPGGMAGQAQAVTAGLVETPHALAHTTQAAVAGGPALRLTVGGALATAGQLAVPMGPAPVGTPRPNAGG